MDQRWFLPDRIRCRWVVLLLVGCLLTATVAMTARAAPPAASFAAPQDYPMDDPPLSVAVGDFNGDGMLDLAATNGGGDSTVVSVWLNTGSGNLGEATEYEAGEEPLALAAGDVDGDGNLDLIVTNYGDVQDPGDTISVLLGMGDGAFRDAVAYPVGKGPSFVVMGDFNVDGAPDLVVANYTENSLSILLNKGDGTFQPPVSVTVGSRPNAIAVGDFNDDGKGDLAVANFGDHTVSILLGTGDGAFRTMETDAVGAGPASITVGDFNGDGKGDLAVSHFTASSVSILLGKGDGTFQAATPYPTGNDPVSVVAGDLNGDGILDLATADNGDRTVSILLGNGDGTFQPRTTLPFSMPPFSTAIGDVNGDGKPDLVIGAFTNYEAMVSVLLNMTAPPIIVRLAP